MCTQHQWRMHAASGNGIVNCLQVFKIFRPHLQAQDPTDVTAHPLYRWVRLFPNEASVVTVTE